MGNALLAAAVELLYPRHCLLCGHLLLANTASKAGEAVPLCPGCFELLEMPIGPRCTVCSQPLISELGLCMRCRTRSYAFRQNLSLFAYDGPIKELIHQYKFHGQRALARLFAALLETQLRKTFPGAPLVPVPARPANVRKRGWDHVSLIAEILRRRYGLSVLPLLRRANGAAQKSLDFEHRATNLRGRILTCRSLRLRVPERLVLLDDVFTTGATAGECTRVLLEHGASEVNVVTIAID